MSLQSLFFEAFAARPRPDAGQILRPPVDRDGDRLRDFLTTRASTDLVAIDLRAEVEGNLWMLTPKAFRYFLPGFMTLSLGSYSSVSVFASELLGALTAPSRARVVEALDRMDQIPAELGFPEGISRVLRKQQLDWFDSGTPEAIFHERFDDLTQAEGAAVLAFLLAFQEAHGADFPFEEFRVAIDGHWARYGAP